MKKTLVGLTLVLFVVSCGNNSSDKKTADSTQAAPEPKKDPCHKNTEASTGPAYQDVAAKYPNDDNTIDSLSDKIIKGGAGHWGQIPMTPHPTLSKDDAKAMLKYIMSLKK